MATVRKQLVLARPGTPGGSTGGSERRDEASSPQQLDTPAVLDGTVLPPPRARKSLPTGPQSDVLGKLGAEASGTSGASGTGPSAADDVAPVGGPTGEGADTRGSGSRYAHLRDRLRGYFGPASDRARERHEQQRDTDRIRVNADSTQGLTAKEQVLRLRSATRLAGMAYMDSLRDSNILVPGFTEGQQQDQLSLMQRMYLQSMTQACFRPLSQGLSPQTVIQAVGMMTTMALCSPDFRQQLGHYAQPLKDGIQRRIDASATTRHAAAERAITARQQRFAHVIDETRRARLIGSTDPRDHLSMTWQRRLDAVQRRERGHRDLYTPETAALTEVALMENAYWRMRDQGADVAQITDSYDRMRQRLHQHCRDDGVERDDVVAHARVILGQRMEFEPELRTMMLGVSHGRLVKSAPEEATLPGSDRTQTVWTGGFEDQVGHRIPDHAMFVLRPPMSGNAHQAHLASTMASSMLHAVETGDTEGYAADLHGYRVGFAVQRQKLSTDGLPASLRARIEQTETMLASMAADGLPPEEQRRVYSNAYLDALEEVNQKHPEAEAVLNQSLGEDWRDTVRRAVDDPAAFYADQRTRWSRAQSRPTGPGPGTPGPQTHAPGPSMSGPEPQP